MTTEQSEVPSAEAINRAITDFIGGCWHDYTSVGGSERLIHFQCEKCQFSVFSADFPENDDYTADLNSLREAEEKIIAGNLYGKYLDTLCHGFFDVRSAITASAEIRALALYRTITQNGGE